MNVPILKLSRKKPFNMEKWIITTTAKISRKIKQKSMQIADWILNAKIVKAPAKSLPAKIKDLMKLILNSKYSDVELSHNYKKDKLSVKKISAFKNNAIIYKMKVIDNKDPLNQMMLLNDRKTFLLNKRLNQLNGIKCNEILEVNFEKLGVEGRMIEKSSTFTSKPQAMMNKN